MTPPSDPVEIRISGREGESPEQKAARGVVIGVGGLGLAVLTFLIKTRVISAMNERWQVSSHGSAESIALLVFITIALALIAFVLVLPLVVGRDDEVAVFAPILLGFSLLSAGLAAVLVAGRERVGVGLVELFFLVLLILWVLNLVVNTIPELIGRIRRSASRRSIDGPE